MKRLTRVLLLTVAAALVACGDDPADSTAQSGGGFSTTTTLKERYEVEYVDGVALIESDTVSHLISHDLATGTLTFSADARDELDFSPGQVVVFSRLSLGKIKAVRESGDNIIVETTPALFTEAFLNADIELETRVGWREPATVVNLPGFQLIQSAVADESWSIGHKFKYKGVDVNVKFMPKSADRLEFEINAKLSKDAKMKGFTRAEAAGKSEKKTVTAADILNLDETPAYSAGLPEPETGDRMPTLTGSAGGSVAAVKATGHITGFVQALQINVRQSSLKKFDFRLKELKGELRVEGAGIADAAGSFDLKLPLEYIIPLTVGAIPMAVKIGAGLKLTPQVHTGSSKFCFKASYEASSGLSFETGSLKNRSNVKTRKADLCGKETVSAAPITVGFGASANFPEISLLIFGNTIVPSIALQAGGSTLYEPGIASAMKPCQAGKVDLQALVKISLAFFGVSMEREAKLWQRKKEWTCEGNIVETTFDPVNGEKKETRKRDD